VAGRDVDRGAERPLQFGVAPAVIGVQVRVDDASERSSLQLEHAALGGVRGDAREVCLHPFVRIAQRADLDHEVIGVGADDRPVALFQRGKAHAVALHLQRPVRARFGEHDGRLRGGPQVRENALGLARDEDGELALASALMR